jgi:hypothetical protein
MTSSASASCGGATASSTRARGTDHRKKTTAGLSAPPHRDNPHLETRVVDVQQIRVAVSERRILRHQVGVEDPPAGLQSCPSVAAAAVERQTTTSSRPADPQPHGFQRADAGHSTFW